MDIHVSATGQGEVVMQIDGAQRCMSPTDAMRLGAALTSAATAMMAGGTRIPDGRSLDELAREAGKR